MASIGKLDAMCLHVVTAWRMLVVRETCIVHVLAHRQCKKFKAWWWCVGGLERREECVCVWKYPGQQSVACHCQPVAQRVTWLDNKATSSTFSMFCVGVSVNGQF